MERVSSVSYLEDAVVGVADGRRLVLSDEEAADGGAPRHNPFDGQRRAEPVPGVGWDSSGHCHPSVTPPVDASAFRTLAIVTVLTFLFIVLEMAGAKISGSVALYTDAAHMLSDLFSFLISLLSIAIARRPATKSFSFGMHRAEVLGAMASILLIWVLTGVLVYVAALRVADADSWTIEPPFMIGTAVAGVAFNLIMGFILHQGGHGHSHGGGGHGHSHGGTRRPAHGHSHDNPTYQDSVPPPEGPGRRRRTVSLTAYPAEDVHRVNRQRNINVRAAFVHVIGDLIQSVGVLIAALVIYFKPEYKLADPICTFVFSLLVMLTTATVLRDTLWVLMEGTPRDVDYQELRMDLQLIEGVRAAHSLHMWSLTLDRAALAVHLAVEPGADGLEVQRKANKLLRYKYNVAYTTIQTKTFTEASPQVEPYEAAVMAACPTCVGPRN